MSDEHQYGKQALNNNAPQERTKPNLEYGSPAFGDISYPQRDKIIKQLNIKER